MPVPLFDVLRDKGQMAELEAAVARVLRSGMYTLGPEVDTAERELADRLGVAHAVGMSSGADALLAALTAIGIGRGDRVAVPTFGYFSPAGAVARVGATPVFVEAETTTGGLDATALADVLAGPAKPKAVIVSHLFGLSADVPAIETVCRKAGVPMIEDAATAIGGDRNGRPVGIDGICSTWSTSSAKHLGGLGEGGFLTTNDERIAETCRALRNHGALVQHDHTLVGGNYRMDAIQAAAVRVRLRHLDDVVAMRRDIAARYRDLFDEAHLSDWAQLPAEVEGHSYQQFVVRVPAAQRDAALVHLRKQGVGCAAPFPRPQHRQTCFADLGITLDAFPVADELAATTLILPLFGGITEAEQIDVVGALANFALQRR
ncbi:MAG: hypothetical protein RL398_909 [Planctomycetota bacterium]|jgi:dTDP-4-amino-4,6-dideoxygalactose transaminase